MYTEDTAMLQKQKSNQENLNALLPEGNVNNFKR